MSAPSTDLPEGTHPGRTTTDGPSVVAIGGGHGLAQSLQAARRYAGSITAVVSVADDGGSSGRLRADHPQLCAPGDARRCLRALADSRSILARTLEYRFVGGGLDGHAFGNLLLAALADELGSFAAATAALGRQVGAVGRVLPATAGPVRLVAHRSSGGRGPAVVGQVAVQNTRGVVQVGYEPAVPASPPEVAAAIAAADQVILGPGSLFTSVVAAAGVPAVRDALAATQAQRVYVANLSPQIPETEGMTFEDHLTVLADHGLMVDVALCHGPGGSSASSGGVPVVERPLIDDDPRVHGPPALADALAGLVGTVAVPRSSASGDRD